MDFSYFFYGIALGITGGQVYLFIRLAQQWRHQREEFTTLTTHRQFLYIFLRSVLISAGGMTLLSLILWYGGIKPWFNQTIRRAVYQSETIAQAYLSEHKKLISHNIHIMAQELKLSFSSLSLYPKTLGHYLSQQTTLHSLDNALIFNRHGKVLSRSLFSYSLEFEAIDENFLDRAKKGVELWINHAGHRVMGVIQLSPHAFLLASRAIDKKVLTALEETKQASFHYRRLRTQQTHMWNLFLLVFLQVTVFLLWLSMRKSMILSRAWLKPLQTFIHKVDTARYNKFSTRLTSDSHHISEIHLLTQAFNRLIDAMQKKQTSVVEVNKKLKERQRFIEGVLSDLAYGVVSFDHQGHILFSNARAQKYAKMPKASGMAQAFPFFWTWIQNHKTTGCSEDQQMFEGRVFRLTLSNYMFYLLTFDDITQVLDNEKKAAWSDIAQRMAHEIKNPLTPIRLATEKLSRMLSQETNVQQYTQTILRQVTTMQRLVSEFSHFARMPLPQMKSVPLQRLVEHNVFLITQNHTVTCHISPALKQVIWYCDEAQMGQVIFNILSNSVQAMQLSPKPPVIHILYENDTLILQDNGPGWSKDPSHLTKPYISYHDKGSGLGLAIVKKIIDDHKGHLGLHPRRDQKPGAEVTITLPAPQ